MSTSKHLITALEKSDWLDRLVILAALAFFVLVVLFILKQRIVDRGLRVALWWTRFVPSFSGDEALLAMEKGEAALSASASSIVTAASTVLASASTAVASIASSATGNPDTIAAQPSSVPPADSLSLAVPEVSVVLPPEATAHDEL